ncbi:non-ribosomal peptide synthetase, partial [Burkholderia sp. Ac-20379]|uniref:non-ribosomal peptide synthetase n=1 Tax=Burkholderia sp. Ac-20379 TaxID=2703900 RepID=UPI00197DE8A6
PALAYGALLERANRLAAHLRARGVVPGMLVAVCVERGAPSIVSLLAVLQAGGVWLPLDPAYPDARQAAILQDAGAGALVLDAATQARFSRMRHGIPLTIRLDRERAAIAKREARALAVRLEPDSPAYMIYTSGSTGRPKGVLVSHGALALHCAAAIEAYALDPRDAVLQFASLHVDTALEQILPTLACGATLVLRGESLWTAEAFRVALHAHRITVADLPPAYLREVLEVARGSAPGEWTQVPRLLIAGGEALPPETARLWQAGPLAGAQLINAYGPTEASITSLAHRVPRGEPAADVAIGRPLAGTEVYVLDRDGNPVPEGVPGELYLGGPRLALGYRGYPELSAARFVRHRLSADREARLYRTGDLACFVPGGDGLIAFRGRLDHQVKLRGFRVELGEIEAALRECGAHDAVVLLRDVAGHGPQLQAYVAAPRAGYDEGELARQLAARLPAYMLPGAYVRLDALPMTPGGKLDRANLPEPAMREARAAQGAPQDATTLRLASIWRRILALGAGDALGEDDHFFALGGHSLACVRLLAALREAFGVDLSIASLIQAPTLGQQAQCLRERGAAEPAPHAAERAATASAALAGVASAGLASTASAVLAGAAPAGLASTGSAALASTAPAAPAGSPLVLLREHDGGGEPLFLVHPVGGNVFCYLELARQLDIGRPIYGIQSRALSDGGHDPCAETGIEAMAAAYVAALREVQPHGEVHLAGWSLGGVIAFEMAQQLRRAGRAVALLALIDSYTPACLAELEANAGGGLPGRAGLLDAFARDLLGATRGAQAGPAPTGDLDALLASGEVARVLPEMDLPQRRRLFEVFEANSRALHDYVPQPYDGPIVAFGAAAQAGHPARGWDACARGGLLIHALPGDHYSLLNAPHVPPLARMLVERLAVRELSITTSMHDARQASE